MIGEKGLKVVLWIASVMYVAIPGAVVWYIWTGSPDGFRVGLEQEGKVVLTVVLFVISFAANFVVWSNFLRQRSKR